jgi:hypothetical protein
MHFSQDTLNLELRRKNIYDPYTISRSLTVMASNRIFETDWRPTCSLTGLSAGRQKGGGRGCTVEPMQKGEEKGEK